ncbi:MAG: signal recognition particle-docking protein FtsY [Pseudomonadota bacterium]
MILWFGKKKKKEDALEAGKAIEAEQTAIDAEAASERADDAAAAAARAAETAGELAEAEELAIEAHQRAEDQLHRAEQSGSEVEAEFAQQAEQHAAIEEAEIAAQHIAAEEKAAALREAAERAERERLDATAAARETAEQTFPDIAETDPETDPTSETKDPGFFSRLTSGLKRSSSKLSDGITGVFTKKKLDDETLEELEDLLITSDLGAKVAARVAANIANDRFDKEITDSEIKTALASEITEIMSPRQQIVDFADGPSPRIVMFVGVNGSGKTTTIGKIASRLKEQGAKAMLVAGDTFRAAAIEQLSVWGDRAGIEVVAKSPGADAAGLVYEAVERARAENYDLVLIDTAGRLQNKAELMSELAKVIRVTQKLDPDAPHDVILVLDATVGQNALSQVEAFRHTAGVTGLVMTKLDGTAKGGVLVAIAEAHELPIHFVGVGEKAEDLQPFSAEAYAKALVGLEAIDA